MAQILLVFFAVGARQPDIQVLDLFFIKLYCDLLSANRQWVRIITEF
jgi:hypothetical protein